MYAHIQMPTVDGEDKVVGGVLKEVRETGNYVRCYMVINFSTHKLRLYPERAEVSTACGVGSACVGLVIFHQYIVY